jgi:hypothetical protein
VNSTWPTHMYSLWQAISPDTPLPILIHIQYNSIVQ